MTPAEQAAWNAKIEQLKALRESQGVKTTLPVAEPPAPEPEPEPVTVAKQDPDIQAALSDPFDRMMKDQIERIDAELGAGPQADAYGQRLFKIRNLADQILTVKNNPQRTPQDVDAANQALDEFWRLRDEEETSAKPVPPPPTGADLGKIGAQEFTMVDFGAEDPYDPVRQHRLELTQKFGDQPQTDPVQKVSLEPLFNNVDSIQDPDLKDYVNQAKNEFYASPFSNTESGEVSLSEMRVNPLELTTGDFAEDPSKIRDQLEELYTMAGIWELTDDAEKLTVYERDRIRREARAKADNAVMAVWGRIGRHNLMVMNSVDKEVERVGSTGAFLAPWRMVSSAGNYVTAMEEDATGVERLQPIPVLERGSSMGNLFRGLATPIYAFLDNLDEHTPTIGGETGWGGRNHLKEIAYGYTNERLWDDVRDSYRELLYVPEMYPEGDEPAGVKTVTGALTAAWAIPTVVYDPDFINVATLGVGKAAHIPDMLARSFKAARASHAERAVAMIDDVLSKTDDEAELIKVFDDAISTARTKPGTPDGMLEQQVLNQTRVDLANQVLEVDPQYPEAFMHSPTAASNEALRLGDEVAEPGVPKIVQGLIGPKNRRLARTAEAATNKVNRTTDAAYREASRGLKSGTGAGSMSSPTPEMARLKTEEHNLFSAIEASGSPELNRAYGQARSWLDEREKVLGALTNDALLSPGRVTQDLLSRARPQQILRALYIDGKSLIKIANRAIEQMRNAKSMYAVEIGAARKAGDMARVADLERRVETNVLRVAKAYSNDLAKMGHNVLANAGDMNIARLISRIHTLDGLIDERIGTVATLMRQNPKLSGMADRVLRLRVLRAAAQDSVTNLALVNRTMQVTRPRQVLEALRENYVKFARSMRASMEDGASIEAPKLQQLWPDHVQKDYFNVDSYLEELPKHFGPNGARAVRTVMDSHIGKVLRELVESEGDVFADGKMLARLQKAEEAINQTAHGYGRGKELARASAYLTTVRHWKNFTGDLTAYMYQVMSRIGGRKLDLIGGSSVGGASGKAKELARRTVLRLRSADRDVNTILSGLAKRYDGEVTSGPDAALEFLTTRVRYYHEMTGDPIVWNQDLLLPHQKAFEYLKSIDAADNIANNLTAKAIANMGIASSDAAEIAGKKALARLSLVIKESKNADDFFKKIIPAIEEVYLKELGKADASDIAKIFLADAINYGSHMYDGWMDVQRTFGPALDSNSANILNYLRVPEASALAVGDLDQAMVTASQMGIPLSKEMRGRLTVGFFLKTMQEDAALWRQGLDRGFGVWLPKTYIDAIENGSVAGPLAKELVEFNSNYSLATSAALRWWSTYRLVRVTGTWIPRIAWFTGDRMGNFSEMILEPGGVGRAVQAMTGALANSIPRVKVRGEEVMSGFSLSRHLGELSKKGSTIARMFDGDMHRLINAADDEIFVSATGERIVAGLEREHMNANGIVAVLATPEIDEVVRDVKVSTRRAAAAAVQAAEDVKQVPEVAPPHIPLTRRLDPLQESASVHRGPDPALATIEDALATKVHPDEDLLPFASAKIPTASDIATMGTDASERAALAKRARWFGTRIRPRGIDPAESTILDPIVVAEPDQEVYYVDFISPGTDFVLLPNKRLIQSSVLDDALRYGGDIRALDDVEYQPGMVVHVLNDSPLLDIPPESIVYFGAKPSNPLFIQKSGGYDAAGNITEGYKIEDFAGGFGSGFNRSWDDIVDLGDGRKVPLRDIAVRFGVDAPTFSGKPGNTFKVDLTVTPRIVESMPSPTSPVKVAFPSDVPDQPVVWAKTTWGDFVDRMEFRPARPMRNADLRRQIGSLTREHTPDLPEPWATKSPAEVVEPDPFIHSRLPGAMPEHIALGEGPPPGAGGDWKAPKPSQIEPVTPPKLDTTAPIPRTTQEKVYQAVAKALGIRLTPKYMQHYAEWVEQVAGRERTIYYWSLRMAGKSREEATAIVHSRLLDFASGITQLEAPYFGRLMMVWRFKRLFMRQLGENIALSLSAAKTQPWYSTLAGNTHLGRMGRMNRGFNTATAAVDWRDEDEKNLDNEDQADEWGRTRMHWWYTAGPHLHYGNPDDATKAWESDVAGRVVTRQEMVLHGVQALDQLYLLNMWSQYLLATTVAAENAVGIDTNRSVVGGDLSGLAFEIAERSIEDFSKNLDPVFETMLHQWTSEKISPKGVLIPRDKAIVYRRIMMLTGYDHKLGYVKMDIDGQLRIDPQWLPFMMLFDNVLMNDVGRNWSAFDTPELSTGKTGEAIARTIGTLSGLVGVQGFDPARDWDYEVMDRAAELRDLKNAATVNAYSKKERAKQKDH